MSTRPKSQNNNKGRPPAQRRPAPDLLQEARALKRWVRLGVYLTIVAFMPFDFFVIRQSLSELVVNNTLYLVVATLAIEVSFAHIFRLRKRIAFPGALILQIGGLQTVAEASQLGLHVLRGFMGFDAAFLALRGPAGDPAPVAVTGMTTDSARRICELTTVEMRRAMAARQPIQAGSVRNYRLVLVPLVSGSDTIGVLALSGERTNRDLLDKQILLSVGAAFGLFLEGLSQKEQLRRSEARNRALLNAIPDTMVRMDRRGVILDFLSKRPPRRQRLFPDQPAGAVVFDLLPDEVAEKARNSLEQTLRTGAVQMFEFTYPSEGETQHREVRVVPAGKDEVLAIIRDVTERKRAEETVHRLAFHDALTGLPNRPLFRDRLELALAQSRRSGQMAAVMFLDLDRFKVVNDTVGHAEGDTLLRQVAGQLTGLVREGDTVARLGGDEFTILLPTIGGPEDAIRIAERILNTLKRPQVICGREYLATGSIGITIYPGDGADADTLLRNADVAMYRAKDLGRNQYQMYTPAMNAEVSDRLALETSMRHALERGHFAIYYQPQVNTQTMSVVGMEALLRWRHPVRGLILPADFIHTAEETGLIIPLGEWVLRTACAQNKAWQDAGYPPLRIAVNLSARQFRQRSLIETVRNALRETGLEPQYLQLEITEALAMHDAELTITMLRDLKEMGVQIAVDDFGIGHSSLNYLKRFPIDAVKIDCSFVRGLTVDPVDAALVTAIIAMSHSLGLKVIAEGVETEEQLAFLKNPQSHLPALKHRQCDEFQGYLFSHPLPPEELEAILTRRERPRARSGTRR
ncbi:MAG: EAL domain-containing protein [Dehalococcoidia bacterium]|nr:EAL domain-containing protein [Dehalococcoidia bacterium]